MEKTAQPPSSTDRHATPPSHRPEEGLHALARPTRRHHVDTALVWDRRVRTAYRARVSTQVRSDLAIGGGAVDLMCVGVAGHEAVRVLPCGCGKIAKNGKETGDDAQAAV